ncbi:hypothetical protein A2U01_0038315 [Trifolium medium]|uniref:Uncharacterized protein n=1 Tax=Trifolium medium TaxID=97028 RepID=A0A392PZ99_9FABA|nr:hypothetical protein [Trifolium medium]
MTKNNSGDIGVVRDGGIEMEGGATAAAAGRKSKRSMVKQQKRGLLLLVHSVSL